MSQSNEIIVVDCDDWMGLYVNGKMEQQGHRCSGIADLIAWSQQHAPATTRIVYPSSAYEDELRNTGALPEYFAEVGVGHEETVRPELAIQ